jgi:hypothetical protein
MSRPKTPADVGTLARAYTARSIEVLGGLMSSSPDGNIRIRAARALLDRGWGTPKETQAITGPDGRGLEIIVRHITEGKKAPQK